MALVAGNDQLESTGDGGPATEAGVRPRDLAIAPDGTMWISDAAGLRRIDEAGTITMVVPYASGGGSLGPDALAGASATEAPLVNVGPLALDAGGRPLLGIWASVYRLEEDLTLTHLAGTTSDELGDGGPATAAGFESIADIASRPDGSLLLLDGTAGLVREVSPDGTITTLGGRPPSELGKAVGPFEATPAAIAAGPDGSALVTVTPTGELVRVTKDEAKVINFSLSLPGAMASFADGTVVVGNDSGVLNRVGT